MFREGMIERDMLDRHDNTKNIFSFFIMYIENILHIKLFSLGI